jgi:hypothetical protein
MTDDELLAAYMRLLPRSRAATPTEWTETDLAALYAGLPEGTPRLPRLYERLLLSYSWHMRSPKGAGGYELYVGHHPYPDHPLCYNLWGNPVGKVPFGPLLRYMRHDPVLWNVLPPARFIAFGQGGWRDYDRVCFDLNRTRGDDCPVISIDHETALCYDKARIAVEFAPTFRELVERTIQEMAMQ